MGRKKKYQTEEERIAARRESARKWKEKNPEKVKEINRKRKNKLFEEFCEEMGIKEPLYSIL